MTLSLPVSSFKALGSLEGDGGGAVGDRAEYWWDSVFGGLRR